MTTTETTVVHKPPKNPWYTTKDHEKAESMRDSHEFFHEVACEILEHSKTFYVVPK